MSLSRQFSRYMVVGGFATIGHYGTLISLVEGGALTPVPAALCAFVAGGVVSYLLNYRVTFESDRPHAEAVPSFAMVAFSGFMITGVLMWAFVNRAGLPYLPAQVVTTIVVFFWTFVANRLWTFRVEGP